jgi:tetratricopeptide (TPR) repeat protein
MAKRKQHRRHLAPLAPRYRLEELRTVDELIEDGRWAEARELLQPLVRQQAPREDLLYRYLNVCLELRDAPGCVEAGERLNRLHPNDPDITLTLAGSYLTAEHPSLALRTFRRFLSRWPDDPNAAEARRTVELLETVVADVYRQLGLSGEQAEATAILHDEVQVLLEQGRYPEARHSAEQLLHRQPDFVPVLNNLSQVDALDGQLDRAIEYAHRVLALEPANLHALANLTRYLCQSGRPTEAAEWAAQLKALPPGRDDTWLKQAEALSYLGDDQGVLDTFAAAERRGVEQPPAAAGLLHHLAAVATMRLGNAAEARKLWQRALKLAPSLELASANLADLDRPAAERHGPWAYSFGYWVARRVVTELAAQTLPAARRDDRPALVQAGRRYLQKHPWLVGLVPILLDRGDSGGREFALQLALLAETPELLAALHDFALGQRGPDEQRLKAAQAVGQAGLLPPGTTRFWLQGAWTDVQLHNYEIHGEAQSPYRPAVQRLLNQALDALRGGDGETAEQHLLRALELEPEAPGLQYNLANAYTLQGRETEATALIRQVHERHPDYLYASVALAQLAILDGQPEQAEALLMPLWTRPRFHVSEFSALSDAQINLHLLRGNREAARGCLALWEQAAPDHPGLALARQRLAPRPSIRERLGLLR